MAIRTQRLDGQSAVQQEDNLKLRLEVLERKLGQSLLSENSQDFQEALAEVADLPDPHRGLAADIAVMQMLSGHRSKPQVWSRFYLAFAEHLFSCLTQNPLEPERWNALGVCLYELGETRASEKCFFAVERLYPEHQAVGGNKQAVKARRRAGTPKRPFAPEVLAKLRSFSVQVEKLAGRAVLPDPASQKLSLVMIVRDEQEMLPECLASVEGLVDQVVVVDTGSKDDTRKIAEEAGAEVFEFPWTGSFSDARNRSLEQASGDWVLQLDADERLLGEDKEKLRSLLSRVYLEGFTLTCTNYTGEGGAGATVVHSPLRLWRNRPEYRFEGAIHEQKSGNMPHYLTCRFQSSDLRILHYGYLKEVIQDRQKSERNLKLLEEEARQSPTPFTYFNLGNEYAQLDDHSRAAEYYRASLTSLQEEGNFLDVGYSGMLAKGLVRQLRLDGQLEESSEWCSKLIPLLPSHTDLVLEEGYLALKAGDPGAAEAAARAAISMGDAPAEMCGVVGAGSFLAESLLGEALERQGDLSGAEAVYRKSLEDYPFYLTPLGSLARVMLASGSEAPRVLDELRPFAEGHPASAGVLLAHSFYEAEAIEQAEALYREGLQAAPSSIVSLIGLVECALSRGDLERVVSLCGDPDQGTVAGDALLRSKVFALLCLSRFDEAESEIGKGLMDSQDSEAFSAWVSLARDGDPLKLSPASAVALLAFLPALLKLQLLDQAEVVLVLANLSELALRERVELSAQAFLVNGYLDSAAEAWLEAIDSLGADPESLYGLACIALSQGRKEEARALALDAVAIDPVFGPALRMISALPENT